MEKDELLEEKIPGNEIQSAEAGNVETGNVEAGNAEVGVEAETGTAENGNEAPVENTAQEENVDNGVAEENPVQEQEPAQEQEPVEQEKMLTQSQVNELVGKARAEGRASAMKELYERYGVNDDNEMNDVFGKGQGYDLLNDDYNTLNGNYKNLSAENALLKSGVVANRYDDVKAILGMKGLDVTVENIQAELTTHPEWVNGGAQVEAPVKEFTPEVGEQFVEAAKPQPDPVKTGTIRKLGSNVPETKVDEDGSTLKKYFGV